MVIGVVETYVDNWNFPYGPKDFFSTGQCVFFETFPQRLWKRNFVETFPQPGFPHSTVPVEKIQRKKREKNKRAKRSEPIAPALVFKRCYKDFPIAPATVTGH